MNPNKEDHNKLLDDWVLCKSKSSPGRKYYFNRKTGISSWTKPEVEDKPSSSKKCSKAEKKRYQEKNNREDVRKRCHKRKNVANEETKRFKTDVQKESQPTKRNHFTSSQSEVKVNQSRTNNNVNNRSSNMTNRSSTQKPLHTQKPSSTQKLKTNLANNRLSQLRQQLALDVEYEKNTSVDEHRLKVSPKNNSEPPAKLPRLELKSPNSNDSKCTVTSQSPTSDSFQSTPSPSQFFAANKIISSIKAQLPEEYNNKEKQKDTFADIEEGICNQMPEYPSNKHPATPPQFSEANKLVSAIKTKLAYRLSTPQDVSVKRYNSAQERMEELRKSLLEPSETSINSANNDSLTKECLEPMEIEESKEVSHFVFNLHPTMLSSRPKTPCDDSRIEIIQDGAVLVVDTNVFIHELHLLKNILNSHIKGYSQQPTLLVPWRVVNELDRLKDSNNGNGSLCKRAKSAMDFLYTSIPENNRVKGQSLRDANSHIYPCEMPDDEILNCCLQQIERGKSVLLISCDKNLCNKAMINNVKIMEVPELKSMLESKPQAVVDPGLHTAVKHCEMTMYELLANILENEMRAKYKELWLHVVYKVPPWQLADVLKALLKHWVAVFQEVFPRIEHLFTDLERSLTFILRKRPESLSQSEVNSFKDLCVDIAKKCQIIPEYMELAKRTVERLVHGKDGAPTVVQAFENVWTIFSSYCAKLATCLGVPHSLEDQLPGTEPVESLLSKWSLFRNKINSLGLSIKGVLSVDNSDRKLEEHVSNLEIALKSSLTLVALESEAIARGDLMMFCIKNRNLLQEAYNKLGHLTEMLDACKNNVHD
ncbi:transcriptional protein SWT1 [Battus philenor]|uniref:transcriptional protein SWT1 n=1 Tax=Battus philenor TaxID=42288 RepID=UPI0035D0CA41